MEIPIERFEPVDKNGKKHRIGIFEFDGFYNEFITLGAKKYAYTDTENKIHITVSGVPKSGSKCLKTLKDFNTNLVFDYKYTNKNTISYNDSQDNFELTDFKGNKKIVTDKYGICLLPCTYTLGVSDEYAELITDESSKQAIFKEG